MSWLEFGMLLCFGASWPCNLYKLWITKSARGVSFPFLALVFAGYVFGLANKLLTAADWVAGVWLANLLMVGAALALAFVYARRENRQP